MGVILWQRFQLRLPGEIYYNYQMIKDGFDELRGLSVFVKDDAGAVFHTYSSYARGNEEVNAVFIYLDITPKGRNETQIMDWVKRHDEYDGAKAAGCSAAWDRPGRGCDAQVLFPSAGACADSDAWFTSDDQPHDPQQQRRYHPQRDRGPSIAARLRGADGRDGFRRQYQAIARDVVDLIEQRAGARQQAWNLAEETTDFTGAFDCVLKPPHRSEIAGDPFTHDRVGRGPHIEFRIKRAGDAFHHHHGFLQQ